MLKNAFPLSTHSGFVAFDGGGAVAEDAYLLADGRRSIVEPQPVESNEAQSPAVIEPAPQREGMPQSATWEPAIGRRARWVEGSVIIAMCAYFLFGFFNVVRG
jgi:hypothetical protein